ncbi:MAG: glycine cleavage system protein GcvH [Pseudomonadota bacterium]
MNNIPHELKYTKSHEWIRKEEDGSYMVGITDHAQSLLGDMVFVELPEAGDEFEAGEECGAVESVKAASEIFCPITGEIIAINEDLEDSPELVNSDPFHAGWLYTIRPFNETSELEGVMEASEYEAIVHEENH